MEIRQNSIYIHVTRPFSTLDIHALDNIRKPVRAEIWKIYSWYSRYILWRLIVSAHRFAEEAERCLSRYITAVGTDTIYSSTSDYSRVRALSADAEFEVSTVEAIAQGVIILHGTRRHYCIDIHFNDYASCCASTHCYRVRGWARKGDCKLREGNISLILFLDSEPLIFTYYAFLIQIRWNASPRLHWYYGILSNYRPTHSVISITAFEMPRATTAAYAGWSRRKSLRWWYRLASLPSALMLARTKDITDVDKRDEMSFSNAFLMPWHYTGLAWD